MQYQELIKKIQHDSGFSDAESKDALELLVESLAIRLAERERKEFASQLPQRLKDMALSVFPTEEKINQPILEQFMEIYEIEADHAKKQILSAWGALKASLSDDQTRRIKFQLPRKEAEFLH